MTKRWFVVDGRNRIIGSSGATKSEALANAKKSRYQGDGNFTAYQADIGEMRPRTAGKSDKPQSRDQKLAAMNTYNNPPGGRSGWKLLSTRNDSKSTITVERNGSEYRVIESRDGRKRTLYQGMDRDEAKRAQRLKPGEGKRK